MYQIKILVFKLYYILVGFAMHSISVSAFIMIIITVLKIGVALIHFC